jgi:hypothetical protein
VQTDAAALEPTQAAQLSYVTEAAPVGTGATGTAGCTSRNISGKRGSYGTGQSFGVVDALQSTTGAIGTLGKWPDGSHRYSNTAADSSYETATAKLVSQERQRRRRTGIVDDLDLDRQRMSGQPSQGGTYDDLQIVRGFLSVSVGKAAMYARSLKRRPSQMLVSESMFCVNVAYRTCASCAGLEQQMLLRRGSRM